jgi:hypothetical protein
MKTVMYRIALAATSLVALAAVVGAGTKWA